MGLFLVALVALVPTAASRAQSDPCRIDWIPTFGGAPGPDGPVYAVADFDDGSGPALYIGGEFSFVGGVAARDIARWDGARWSAVGSGLQGRVMTLAVHDDGSGPALYAGGFFTGPHAGVDLDGVARWNGERWEPVLLGFDGAVLALRSFDSGTGPMLYAGGNFLHAGPRIRERCARWDGSAWQPVDALDDAVWAFGVHDDGTGPALYAGGEFTQAIGTGGAYAVSRVARLDGVRWQPLGAGLDADVWALESHAGTLIAGGRFSRSGTQPLNGIAAWSGTSWSGLGAPSSTAVRSITRIDEGAGPQLLFVGQDGLGLGNLWRLTGTTVVSEMTFARPGPFVLGRQSDGGVESLVVGGDFTRAGDTPVRHIAARTLGAWKALGQGLSGDRFTTSVRALADFDGGSGRALHAAGRFDGAGGQWLASIGRWDGSRWHALGGGLLDSSGQTGYGHALVVHDDGHGPELFVGGGFASADGVPARSVAAWNGHSFRSVGGAADGITGSVEALVTHDDGNGTLLYAAGNFTAAGGLAVNVARWNGNAWSALGAGLSGHARALASFDDGSGARLYAAGSFNGTAGAPGLARWDGAGWTYLQGLSDARALAVHDDGSGPALFVSGYDARLMRWDGVSLQVVSDFLRSASDVECLASVDLGDGPALYAGGSLRSSVTLSAHGVLRWRAGLWEPLGGSTYPSVHALHAFDGGQGPKLHLGGDFEAQFEGNDSFLARYGPSDVTAPVLDVPEAVFRRDAPGTPAGEVVTFFVAATDDRDPAPVVLATPPSGSVFPRGVTLVTVIATDTCGNVAHASFEVRVEPGVRRR